MPCKAQRSQFYDTPWGEALAGVERLRPQFFEGLLVPGALEYREFSTIGEIKHAAHAVDMVAAIDYLLFDCLSLKVEYLMHDLIHSITRNEPDSLKARPVFLTILARHIITGQTTLEPLTEHELNAFLSLVWQKKLNDQQGANAMQRALYDDTLQWITSQYTVTEKFVPAVEEFISSALNMLQHECAPLVNQQNINCRYINSLLIKKKH
jgi:hypothetical protein